MKGYTNYKRCFEEADKIIDILKVREEKARIKRREKEKEERRLAELNGDYETLAYYEEMDRMAEIENERCYEPDFDKLVGPEAELEELLDSMDRVPVEYEISCSEDPILIGGLHERFPGVGISTLENITELVYDVYSDLYYETNNNIIRCCLAIFALSTYDCKELRYYDIRYEDIEFLRKSGVLDRGIESFEKIIVYDVVKKMYSEKFDRENPGFFDYLKEEMY